jgi:hypothetical protein
VHDSAITSLYSDKSPRDLSQSDLNWELVEAHVLVARIMYFLL